MSASDKISRRAFAGGLALLGLPHGRAYAQGFAGLGQSAEGFAKVTPGKTLSFPADHGAHPDYRIEWWYLTANLVDAAGSPCGLQWTLFRQAMRPGPQSEGWASQQLWMGHAAVTRADKHRFHETFARGGIGQAGVETKPFAAWIDAWQMRGSAETNDERIAPLTLKAAAADFSYDLTLDADRPLVLQGDGGYIRKAEGEQATYYYSQPFFTARGHITIEGKPVDVSGQAWMDREWGSQLLAADQTGWDWFALHFSSGQKLMLYRIRQKDGDHAISGNWILPKGATRLLTQADVVMTPKAAIDVAGRKIPGGWQVAIASLSLAIDCVPLNPQSYMRTSFPYWEGPISFSGSHSGVGYLEMTGY
ncbi:MAG TPA: lipocalin-like domain-containing protein [Bradyrhizobium sp.]|nr:lipocalin-like domain-containing protein [Bradyrhizobium sp.]